MYSLTCFKSALNVVVFFSAFFLIILFFFLLYFSIFQSTYANVQKGDFSISMSTCNARVKNLIIPMVSTFELKTNKLAAFVATLTHTNKITHTHKIYQTKKKATKILYNRYEK